MKSQLKAADKSNAQFVLIIGEDEMNTNIFQLKNLKKREQISITTEDLLPFLKDNLKNTKNQIH